MYHEKPLRGWRPLDNCVLSLSKYINVLGIDKTCIYIIIITIIPSDNYEIEYDEIKKFYKIEYVQ